MKNKLIFRILGALASALIITAVFIPFVDVTGYSPSLWETYELTNSLYLPIMIIAFGAIGVIFFALNVKTEFAYMSVGAITFFIVIRTIDILDQDAFNSLSIGYYSLVIGTFLTGLMAFLTNLKSKRKVEVIEETKKEESSVLEQIDKLYNEQSTTSENEITPIQPIDTIVQPLPIQPLETVGPVEPIVEEKIVEEVAVTPVEEVEQKENIEVIQETISEPVQVVNEQVPVNPVLQEFNTPIIEETKVEEFSVVEPQPVTPTVQPVNPVLQEFSIPNTVVADESQIVVEQPINPVLQEFSIQNTTFMEEPKIEEVSVVEPQPMVETSVIQPANPVLQEFGIPNTPIVELQPQNQVYSNVQEFNNTVLTQNLEQPSTEFDIFGQPINKS